MKLKNTYKPSVSHHEFLIKDLKRLRTAIGYLNASLASGDEQSFLLALHNVVEAQGGISKVAKMAKIHRVSLHRIMSKHGNPELHNLTNILSVLGLKLAVVPEQPLKYKHAA